MLRNREIQHFAVVFAGIAVLSAVIGFQIHRAAGLLVLADAAAFGMVFYCFTRARYRNIARISDQIDRVLHHAEHIYMSEAREGELSILQSEITKMTQRIREQNQALMKEKKHLADSLADIAHQLRTPLTSVNLVLSLLENPTEEAERKVLLRETETLLEQMDWLLTSLLKLSRLDAGIVVFQREKVDVNVLIHTALRPLLISMELRNIDIQTGIVDGITIWGDMGWLSEALQNIFKNCMESAGNHGKIEVTGIDNPLYTELTIHDSGAGFDKEELPNLFNRFYRGNKAGATGYGIGLALCKMIITRQGGTITADNHQRGGAVFVIRFPK